MEKVLTPEQCYVPPHSTICRKVVQKDIKRVIKDGQLMFELCTAPVGNYRRAYAIAHSQITDKDPLRFFVTSSQAVIINPAIVRKTEALKHELEGCMTFPLAKPVLKGRSYRCEVEYQTIDPDGKLTEVRVWHLKGIEARMIQHEIDHLNGIYLYPFDVWQKLST